ncbi:MAG: phosphotransferase [Celeribacter marinus]
MLSNRPSMAIIRHAQSFLEGDISWETLTGGRTNAGWVGRSKTRALVYKLYCVDRGNLLFPNSSAHEWACLAALVGTGLAPEPVARFDTPDGTVVAYEFVVGDTATQITPDIMQAMHRIHMSDAPIGIRAISTSPADILEMGDRFVESLDAQMSKRLRGARPIPRQLTCAPCVFLHGDIVPANVIKTPTGVCFLDWQCPAIGDAVQDIYVALSPVMHRVYGSGALTSDGEQSALNAYPDTDAVARFHDYRPYLAWRMAAYCAWKDARGEGIYADCVELELSRM